MFETYNIPQKWRDLASRAAWTLAQVATSLLITWVADLPPATALALAPALSALKSYIATKVGNAGTVTFTESDTDLLATEALRTRHSAHTSTSGPRPGTVPGEPRDPTEPPRAIRSGNPRWPGRGMGG